jgi:hypothetical protein
MTKVRSVEFLGVFIELGTPVDTGPLGSDVASVITAARASTDHTPQWGLEEAREDYASFVSDAEELVEALAAKGPLYPDIKAALACDGLRAILPPGIEIVNSVPCEDEPTILKDAAA